LEAKYGSLMRGLLAQRKEAAQIGANTRISKPRMQLHQCLGRQM
jgi:hypothetical protein